MNAPKGVRHKIQGLRPTCGKECAGNLQKTNSRRIFAAENNPKQYPPPLKNKSMDSQNEKLQHAFDDDAEMTRPVNHETACDDEKTQVINDNVAAETKNSDAPAEAPNAGEGRNRAKTAAAAAAAAALGAGAGYAAAEVLDRDAVEPEPEGDELDEDADLEDADVLADDEDVNVPANNYGHVEPAAAKPNAAATPRAAQTAHHGGHAVPEAANSGDATFDFVGVETMTDDDGNEVQVVDAVVEGHRAIFLADAEGHVVGGAIDANDDGKIDDDEVIGFEEGRVTINDLAALDNVGEKPDNNILYASNQPAENPQGKTAAEDDTFDVLSVEEIDADGTSMLEVTANVGGHGAAFMADAEGNLVVGAIDLNDDDVVGEDEILDFSDSGVTVDDLIAHDNVNGVPDVLKPLDGEPIYLADDEVQEEVDPAEVNVLGVSENVDIDGNMVDVAFAEIDEVPVIIVDEDQNGIVDVLIADVNGNDVVDADEVYDVSDAGIEMPTEADVVGNFAEAGVEDYINDADAGYFDV